MKKIIITLTLIFAFTFSFAEEDPNDFNVTKVGDKVPEFSFRTLDGKTASISDYKGKTILLTFFATWCSPCMKKLPEIQKQIWDGIKNDNLVVLNFGRGHSQEELEAWNTKKCFTFPIAPDKDKSIYELFFTRYIPRTVLVNTEGKIILQEFGYTKEDFEHLVEVIKKEIQ